MIRWLGGISALGLVSLFFIAGSDRLFLHTVPLEQRLVAHNDAIRKKAQQELLGASTEAKRDSAVRLIPALSDNDPFVRKWAAIALALVGPAAQDALPALLHGVSDRQPDVAQACRVALTEIGTPDVQHLPTLIQDLQDPHEAVRCEAATSLARLGAGAREALPAFFAQMRSGSPIPDCYSEAVGRLLAAIPSENATVVSMTRSSDVITRRNAAEVLARTDASPSTIQVLLDLLADETDGSLRRLVARALHLRYAPERGWLASWTFALRHSKDPAVRLETLHALQKADWSGPDKWDLAARVLDDASAAVRLGAAQWLAQAGPDARTAGASAVRALQDADPQIRLALLAALRRMNWHHRGTLPAIARIQRDEHPEVRCAAAEQLVDMDASDRVAVPMLVGDMKNGGGEIPCAVEALSLAGHENGDVVPAMIRALQDKNPEVERRAVHVLMSLGARAKAAIPALTQAAKENVPGADLALRLVREALPKSEHTRRHHSR